MEDETLTAKWWLVRLYAQLMLRNRECEKFDRYYRGDFDVPWLAEEAAADFKRIMHMTRSNYMCLVVNAMVERMNLTGFRRANSEAAGDTDLWEIWKANKLQSQHNKGLLEAAIYGAFYYMASPPRPKKPGVPCIYIESPTQCIVEHVPGTNRREAAAGLKAWIDDLTGKVYATVYLPDSVWKFQADDPMATPRDRPTEMPGTRGLAELMAQWEPREGEDLYSPNPLGEVPLVESPNNPRLLLGGQSEIAEIWPIQDRVNKTIADRMMAQDYGAFPQKWASGWPTEDDSGTAQEPIEIGVKRIVTTDVAETKFGQWEAAGLDPYIAAKRDDVVDIASISRTPPHYLIVGMTSVNGATLKAAESGLVSKVTQRIADHSDPACEAVRMACELAGIELGDDLEAVWSNPEYRTQAETTDSLIKMKQAADMPTEIVWELWGATPPEIARWKAKLEEEREEAAKRALMFDPATQLADQMRAEQGMSGDGEFISNDDERNGDPLPGGGKPADDPQKVITPNGVTA